MRPGIALRPDYDAAQLRALAKASRNAGQSRRLLALAEIYDGGSRTKAARIGGVGLQTAFGDWVVRFNARGPDSLIDRQSSREHLQAEAAMPGTGSSTSPGSSCPSAFTTGPMHDAQRGLVLVRSGVGRVTMKVQGLSHGLWSPLSRGPACRPSRQAGFF